jgi:hypothetical protein
MVRELAEHSVEVTATEDQHPVETFSADGPDEALGDGVGAESPHRRADDTNTLRMKDLVEGTCELGITITNEVLAWNHPSDQGPSKLTGLLGHPGSGWMGRHACEVDAPGFELDEEQDVETSKQHLSTVKKSQAKAAVA